MSKRRYEANGLHQASMKKSLLLFIDVDMLLLGSANFDRVHTGIPHW